MHFTFAILAYPLQVVHVCAEHKKPAKLLKHFNSIKAASLGARNPPRILVFANRIKVSDPKRFSILAKLVQKCGCCSAI